MNSWSGRFQLLLVMVLVMSAHSIATVGVANSPAYMLVFHGSAALLDWILAFIVPAYLSGRRCEIVQWLMIGSILGNFAGWILYMNHFPPVYFNALMWTLTVVQCVFILAPDLRDAAFRNNLVSGAHRVSSSNNP